VNPRKLILAALLFALGYATMRSCEARRAGAAPPGAAREEQSWHVR
jgi:hypothetical protein